jgi:hypothetical protein
LNLIPAELNRRLSDLVRDRIAADGSLIAGRSAFWRLVGVGFLSLGLGTAVGIGFYGYSYVMRNSDNIRTLSSTFAKALNEAHLQAVAEGRVEIDPHELALAKGQTVSIDSNSRVLLDPSARVLADGELQVQVPSISVPRASRPQGGPVVPTITNFEVFKSVPFEKGTVMTGWVFLTSTQRSPTAQHCYYTESAETSEVHIDLALGTDGRRETPKTKPKDFDLDAAFDRCVWFKSE